METARPAHGAPFGQLPAAQAPPARGPQRPPPLGASGPGGQKDPPSPRRCARGSWVIQDPLKGFGAERERGGERERERKPYIYIYICNIYIYM